MQTYIFPLGASASTATSSTATTSSTSGASPPKSDMIYNICSDYNVHFRCGEKKVKNGRKGMSQVGAGSGQASVVLCCSLDITRLTINSLKMGFERASREPEISTCAQPRTTIYPIPRD